MRRVGWFLWLVLALLGGGGFASARADDPKPVPLKVVVTVAPLKGLVEPLLPEGSSVTVLMRPGKSEHGYEFTPADLAAVAKADLVVFVGLGIDTKVESALRKQNVPQRQFICFADAVDVKAG